MHSVEKVDSNFRPSWGKIQILESTLITTDGSQSITVNYQQQTVTKEQL